MKAGRCRVGDRFWIDDERTGRVAVELLTPWQWGLVHGHAFAEVLRLDNDKRTTLHTKLDADLEPYEEGS